MKREWASDFKAEYAKLWKILVEHQQSKKKPLEPTRYLLELFFIRFLGLKLAPESQKNFSFEDLKKWISQIPALRDFSLADEPLLLVEWQDINDFCQKFKWELGYSEESNLITPEILEWIAEQSADKTHVGTVYTPKPITDNIVHTTIMAYLTTSVNNYAKTTYKDIYSELITNIPHTKKEFPPQEQSLLHEMLVKWLKSIKICDNACGGGNFLVSIWHCLLDIYRRLAERGIILEEFEVKSSTNKLEEYLFRIGQEILVSNIYGVDINPNAILGAKLRLWLELIQIVPSSNNTLMNALLPDLATHLIVGNTLIGSLQTNLERPRGEPYPMLCHWKRRFPEVFADGGFHIIVGNPPYGQNNLQLQDRRWIEFYWQPLAIGKKSDGKTYNSAALFIERSYHLLREDGWLGYIVNNSVARVDEFSAIRKFLFRHGTLKMIIDEGNPFKDADVTLEMITIFFEKSDLKEYEVNILNQRVNPPTVSTLPITLWRSYDRIILYADEIFKAIYQDSYLNVLHGTRGRDIEKKPVCNTQYNIPYLFSGKSIKKFRVDEGEVEYAPHNILEKPTWKEEYLSDSMLVATKINNKYRISLKPLNFLVGNNVIKITAQNIPFNPYVIAAILNSKLMDFIVYRYILNYSDLTTAFYDSITSFTPVKLPQNEEIFVKLTQILIFAATTQNSLVFDQMMKLLNAAVYELYFSKHIYGEIRYSLQQLLDGLIPTFDFLTWWNMYWESFANDKTSSKETNRAEKRQRFEENLVSKFEKISLTIHQNGEITKQLETIFAHPWVHLISQQQKER